MTVSATERQSKQQKNGQTTETKASYNVYNQLTSMGNESFTYDKNGNRLTDGTYSHTWDAADQMTAVTKKRRNEAIRHIHIR